MTLHTLVHDLCRLLLTWILKSSYHFVLGRKWIKSTGLFWFAWGTMKLKPKYFQSLLFSARQIHMKTHSCLHTWPTLNRLDTSCWLNNWNLEELEGKLILSYMGIVLSLDPNPKDSKLRSRILDVVHWK